MKIAIASDLHLEFADIDLVNPEGAEVLILAGDILIAQDLYDHSRESVGLAARIESMGMRQGHAHRYRGFIDRVAAAYTHVVAVAGNHEFYHGRWVQSLDVLRAEYQHHPNIHFLEGSEFRLPGITFVGGTLWTSMHNGDPITLWTVGQRLNDFRVIRHDGQGFTRLRPAHAELRHRQTLAKFDQLIAEARDRGDRVVVISHHAPSELSVNPEYKNDHHLNGGYYTDLSEFILARPEIQLWVHGHMHHPVDYPLGTTRVLTHPRGYVGHDRGSQDDDPFTVRTVEI